MNCDRTLRHVVSMFLLSILLLLAVSCTDNGDNETPPPSSIELNAIIGFDGAQFVIQNTDSFDWTNVELGINSKTFSRGYLLEYGKMASGRTYTVSASQFTKSDGQKFNPLTHKPLDITIWADTSAGEGLYIGRWK